ncbi:MAG: ribosome biogenesis GTPase Der [Spirochaetota bacterium]
MQTKLGEPTIAIVGRPNVGKSTLFNRLIGRRRAITDPTPGVTRDPVVATARIDGRPLRVVDTGGYTTDGDELAQAISDRALAEIRDADVVLLVVDGTGLTALDELFLDELRPYKDRLVLVVNKIDAPERESLVWDFYRLGLERVVGISAAHARGTEELLEAIDEVLGAAWIEGVERWRAADREDALRERERRGRRGRDWFDEEASEGGPAAEGEAAAAGAETAHGDEAPRTLSIAVLGQPNTGKSTLVNRLTERESSLVSPVPGTTRDVIEGEFEFAGYRHRILDTAGIRRKNRVSENIEYYSVTRAIDTIEEADVVVLLVDAEKGLSDQDKKIAALVVDRGRGLVIGLNKWDLLPQIANQFEAVRDRILFVFPVITFAPIIPLSAQTGSGVKELLKAVGTVHRQLHHRVDTGNLNRHLERWVEQTPPPVRGRGRLKIRYMTQVQRLPVTFVAFVNRKKGFPESYVSYLKNRIRADFGLSSIPFRLELRER